MMRLHIRFPVYDAVGIRFVAALVLLGVLFPGILLADAPSAPLPDQQTFQNLDAALTTLASSDLSESLAKEVAETRLVVDNGALLLIAGRIGEAAVIAERVRVLISIFELQAEVDALSTELREKRAMLKDEVAALSRLKQQLSKALGTENAKAGSQ